MTPPDIDDLVESWAMGNRTFVMGEILRLRKAHAVLVMVQVAHHLNEDDHDVLCQRLEAKTAVAPRRNPGTDRMKYPVLMTDEGKAGRLVRKRVIAEARIDGDSVTIGLPEDM